MINLIDYFVFIEIIKENIIFFNILIVNLINKNAINSFK